MSPFSSLFCLPSPPRILWILEKKKEKRKKKKENEKENSPQDRENCVLVTLPVVTIIWWPKTPTKSARINKTILDYLSTARRIWKFRGKWNNLVPQCKTSHKLEEKFPSPCHSFFFFPLLKLGYLTEEGKINLSDSQFSNQPKPSPFASLHVHACKPFSLPRKKERKKKETQGPVSPD